MKNKRVLAILLLMLTLSLTACNNSMHLDNAEVSPELDIFGIIPDNIDVPQVVLDAAIDYAKGDFEGYRDIGIAAFKEYGAEFDNWRLDYLEYAHTYGDINVEIYRFQWRIHTTTPDILNELLVGGMSMTDDGWLIDTYSDSWYLYFDNSGSELVYLGVIMNNEGIVPGDVEFYDDLLSRG